MNEHKIDISEELCIVTNQTGVCLLKPEEMQISVDVNNSFIRVKDILALPFNIYFLSTADTIVNANEKVIVNCGFTSLKSAIGKTIRAVAKPEVAEILIKQDLEVLKKKHATISGQHYIHKNNKICYPAFAIRYPLYNGYNNIIGIFAIAVPIEDASVFSLVNTLNYIINLGLLKNLTNVTESNISSLLPVSIINNICLSPREAECLRSLAKGKTAKMIARELNLSTRTVEHYLENIKFKFNVNSKYDLINKAAFYFLR
jgi:DNA-binding CsgD family transcriptional regulator